MRDGLRPRLVRDTIRIDPAFRERLRRAGLDTVDRVLKCLGDQIVAWSRSTDTIRVELPADGGGAVFIKRYHFLRWGQRIKAMLRGAFFGRSRARSEFERIRDLRARGAPMVRPVAWGERRILHFVRSSFLVTEAVPGAVPLSALARQDAGDPGANMPVRQRRRCVEALGRCIADLHRRGLSHGALFWRNVLVRRDGDEFDFVLLDPPGRRHLSLRKAEERRADGIADDLAAIAALAPELCSRTDMLRFFTAYLGTRRLAEAHRRQAREILTRARPLVDHERYRLKMDRIFHYHLVPAAIA